MLVSKPNNVSVYNLSSGKSLPEWISDRKKRQLLKKVSVSVPKNFNTSYYDNIYFIQNI